MIEQRCRLCDAPTGRAGAEDSLTVDGEPVCEDCFGDSRPLVIFNAPEEIWLNCGETHEDEEFSDLGASGEVTWCRDPVHDSDVRYIRADLAGKEKPCRD